MGLATAWLAAGGSHAAAPDVDPVLARGHEVYAEHCEECHGSDGHGDGAKSERLRIHPRDFTRGVFKCRSTPSGQPPTDEDLARTIAQGMAGTAMPRHKDLLAAADIQAVARYVRSLATRGSAASPPAPIALPDPPPPSARSVVDGQQIYRLLECWKCHGDLGLGDGPSAAKLQDTQGRPIKPGRFAATGDFKCGGTERDIYRTIHTGLDGSPMPSFTLAFLYANQLPETIVAVKERFGAEAADALVAYLRDEPDAATIARLDEAGRSLLISRRSWALVSYIRSLVPPLSRTD